MFDCFLSRVIPLGFNIQAWKAAFFLLLKNSVGLNLKDLINQPLWFLGTLFFMEILFYFVIKLGKRPLYALIPLSVFFSVFINRNSIFCLSYIVHVAAFFLSGYVLKGFMNKEGVFRHVKVGRALAVIACICLAFSSVGNVCVDIQWFYYGKLWLYYLNGFLGIFVMIFLAEFLSENRLLRYLGRHTMPILCIHYFITRKCYPMIFRSLGLERYLYRIGTEFVLTLITLLILSGLIKFGALFFQKFCAV